MELQSVSETAYKTKSLMLELMTNECVKCKMCFLRETCLLAVSKILRELKDVLKQLNFN